MGKKNIEVYSDGSAYGKSLIALVHKLACPKCEVVVREGAEGAGEGEGSFVRIDGKAVDPNKFAKAK